MTLLVVALLCIVAGLTLWPQHARVNGGAVVFDSVAWKGQNSGGNVPATNIRDRMIEDLLESHNFQSWTQRQVINLLGTPDANIPNGLGSIMRYYLGNGADYLAFELYANGVVKAYYVIRP
ncbi:MAG TPA: hypothetical protein PLC98_24755 [Anaerolineales bacterium]|nr:hypothetical protein [Anaerolineales bacterium]